MPTFPRTARMLHASDYAATLRTRPVARGSLLVINHKKDPQDSPAESKARLGLIVPKRFLKKAVSRNTVKRMVREQFRILQDKLPPGNYAVRLNSKPAPLSLTMLKDQIRSECELLLKKLITK